MLIDNHGERQPRCPIAHHPPCVTNLVAFVHHGRDVAGQPLDATLNPTCARWTARKTECRAKLRKHGTAEQALSLRFPSGRMVYADTPASGDQRRPGKKNPTPLSSRSEATDEIST